MGAGCGGRRGIIDAPPSLLDAAGQVAEAEGGALNPFINVVVWTESHFQARAPRTDIPKTLGILRRAGACKPPANGDGLPKP